MKYEELNKNLNSEISPCYIINGGESYLTTMALSKIEKAINLSFADINKNVFYDSTTKTAKDIVESCEELPFCDNKRLIVVHDYLNKKNEQEKKIFATYLKRPNPTTCLVFFSTNKSDFFTTLEREANATVVECDKVFPETLNAIINGILQELKLKIKPDALTLLKDYCNYSITKIYTELLKFKVTFPNDDYVITQQDVENYVTKDIEYAIFDLTNAISKKNSQLAFLLIENMLKNKEQPISIISAISNHFRRLFFIARSKYSNVELSEMLNVKEFAVKKYKEQVNNFTIKQLKNIFDLCIQVEFNCKSGAMDGKNALVYLISAIFN